MNKLSTLLRITRQMGLRYTLYRGYYELKKWSGILKWQFPTSPDLHSFIHLDQWRKNTPLFFFEEREDVPGALKEFPVNPDELKRLLDGELYFFSGEWVNLGKNYDWLTHPLTGYRYPGNLHWSEINEFSREAGDIKYLWEKSRFTFVYPVLRYDLHHGTDHSEFVFSEIASWIRSNAINIGPNYICSQEISIRLMNWTFAMYFYKNSKYLTADLFQEIMHNIFWQINHVYRNIRFSRLTVRNNHAMAETFLLFFAGLVFPFLPGSKKWRKKGKKWFEIEADYQVYNDGTYLQFSMNYHRVVIQLFTWMIALSRIHRQQISEKLLEKAYKSVNFLLQCQEPCTGHLPNYGANDGALFFPLSSCVYRDFRPQLNALHRLLTGNNLYPNGPWLEESLWFSKANPVPASFPVLSYQTGISRFDTGGYYLFREEDTLTFIRCGSHRDRPSQADNLHLDIWYKGENLLLDAGSYRYNCSDDEWKYFSGSTGHNTITIDGQDQMRHGGRFIWYGWTQATKVDISMDDNSFYFKGTVRAFLQLGNEITLTRSIKKEIGNPHWEINDSVSGLNRYNEVLQHWHTLFPESLIIASASGPATWTDDGWYSETYGLKKRAYQTEFKSRNRTIKTEIGVL